MDRGLQHRAPALRAAHDVARRLRAGPCGRQGSLKMSPASPQPTIRRCSAPSRSYLLGPCGPAGAPPGQRLRSGSYMAANKKRDQARSAQSECPRFQGNPGPHRLSERRACGGAAAMKLPTARRGLVHFSDTSHKADDSDYPQLGELDTPRSWRRLGNGQRLAATAGSRSDRVPTARCRDHVSRGLW
jgi:hypothetical protein